MRQYDNRVGTAVATLRHRMGWAQKSVSDLLGISQAMLSLFERGRAGTLANGTRLLSYASALAGDPEASAAIAVLLDHVAGDNITLRTRKGAPSAEKPPEKPWATKTAIRVLIPHGAPKTAGLLVALSQVSRRDMARLSDAEFFDFMTQYFTTQED